MIDVFAFLAAVLAYAAALPHLAVRRHLPRLDSNPDAVQAAYEAGARRRRILRFVPPAFLVYFLLRAALSRPPHGQEALRIAAPYFAAFGVVYVLSLLTAALWRYGWDRRFVARHPEFADSLQPLAIRLFGPMLILVLFASIAAAIALVPRTPWIGLTLYVAGIAIFMVGRRLLLSLVVRTRVPVPLDSPLGRSAAGVVRDFGFEPKRVILVPTVVANAFALPDGSVMVTTALHHIATEEEIAGILAHELSHAKDRDVRLISRARLLLLLFVAVATLGTTLAVQFLPAGGLVTVPVAISAFLSAGIAGQPLLTRRTQALEFKCDRAAARIGAGPALGLGLRRLHDYMSIPHRWLPGDARFFSHPSLDVRLASLRENGDYPRP